MEIVLFLWGENFCFSLLVCRVSGSMLTEVALSTSAAQAPESALEPCSGASCWLSSGQSHLPCLADSSAVNEHRVVRTVSVLLTIDSYVLGWLDSKF